MKTNTFSLIGYIFAVFLIIFMDVRFLWIFTDFGRAALWTGLGLLLIVLSWIYNRINNIEITLLNLEEHLADKNER